MEAASMRDEILNQYPDHDFLFLDGFDEAIVGVSEVDEFYRVVYSSPRIVSLIIRGSGGKMSVEDALDFFHFNIKHCHVGEKTPIYLEEINIA